jgi:hypothetical protein
MNQIALNDLLPGILKLTVFEKLRLIRILAEDIEQPAKAKEEILDPHKIYYVHTPQFEAGAARQLMNLLETTSPEN